MTDTTEPSNAEKFGELMAPIFDAMTTTSTLAPAPAAGDNTADDLMRAIQADTQGEK